MSSPSSPPPSPITSSSVPDLSEVRAWLEKMIVAVKFAELITAILALIGRMAKINMDLVKQIALHRRGRPHSEKLARLEGQLALPLEGLLTPRPKPKTEDDAPERKLKGSRRGRHPGRALLPEHLRREVVFNEVPEEKRDCPLCGRRMTTVGHDACEILEVKPAELYVLRRMDERVACPHDDSVSDREKARKSGEGSL